MQFKSTITTFIIVIGLCACSVPEKTDTSDSSPYNLSFAERIQESHKKERFYNRGAVSADINLFFGGKERLNARLTLSADGSSGHYLLSDGSQMIYKHDSVWVSSDYPRPSGARFSAYTWSYFFLMPFKLNDPGTNWSFYPDTVLNGKAFNTRKLTFDAGTGDAPDDWYIVYSDPKSGLLDVAAYIVTAGQSQEEAEEDPHAIKYSDYRKIDGVPFAHRWDFFAWRADSGLTDTLGYAILKNFQLGEIDEELFYLDEDRILISE